MKDSRPPRDIVDLRRGQALLEEALADFRGRLEDHREAFSESLEASITSPMREAFSRAREAHEELALEAGLTTKEVEAREPDPLVGTALTRYREGVRLQVLEPLRSSLKEMEVGQEVTRRWQGFRDGLPGLAESLPPLLYRQEPDDLFGRRGVDGQITALRKGVIRGWRGVRDLLSGVARWILRFVGRREDLPLPPVQTVPLRALARECLLGRIPLRLEPIAEVVHQHLALPIAALETAVAEWTERWFSAEEAIRLAEGHLGTRFQEEVSRDLPPPTEASAPVSDEEIEPEAPMEDEPSTSSQDPFVLREISRKLADALEAGAVLSSPSEAEAGILEALELEWDHLLEEVRVAGSFQASTGSRKARRRADRLLERVKARARTWEAWHQNAPERLLLSVLLLRLRESLGQAASQLMGRIVEEALAPLVASWKKARAELEETEKEATAIFSNEGISGDTQALARAVDALRVRAEARLATRLAQVMEEVGPLQTVRQVGDRVAGDLSDSLRYLPDSIPVTPLQEDEHRVTPTVTVRNVPFREAVLQTVDVLRLEALRNSTQPLTEFLRGAAEECREIPNILSFNLTAARDELLTPPEGPLELVLEDARSLTVDGLVRTAGGVEALLRGLLGPWREFTQEADGLLRRSFSEIHSRAVAEGAVQEQMLDLRARGRAWIRRSGDWAREWNRRLRKRTSRTLRKWRARGAKLVHLGRAAVGTPVTQEGEAERAMETLRGIPQLLDSLPLVYRRLYSFQAVSDPNLLVGREAEMEWVARRLAAWKGGGGVPCLLTGPVGVGHTSFLNVLAATHLEGYRVFRVTLDRRIPSEESLAPFLAEALDIGDQDPWTLGRIERHLLDDSAFQDPAAVLLEHLEHLFLRVPGGTDLLESFISLQARTSGRVFWLSNTSGAAWKVLEKSEPRAAALLNRHPLPTLSRADLESLIMVRHRRSGLPVEFVQPPDLNPLIRRKLRRTRGDKAKQAIIREDFFDRIFRMSDGNVAMAILLWLRAADFSSREGWLRVVAPSPLRFAFLEELDLTMDFALKGFLEHGTLTLEEYGKVFGTAPQEAFQVFEALRSRMLLESLGTRGGLPSPLDGVREGERYRVPGILSQVVAHRLRNRNILH